MLYDIFLVINNRKQLSGCNCTLDLSCNFVQETCSDWIYWGNSKISSSFSVPVASSIRLGYNLEQCSSLVSIQMRSPQLPMKVHFHSWYELEWDCFVISFGRSNCFAGSLVSKLLLVNDFPLMSEMRIFHDCVKPTFVLGQLKNRPYLIEKYQLWWYISFKIRFFWIWRTSGWNIYFS